MNRREWAEQLVERMVREGYTFALDTGEQLWIEPEPDLGQKADLLQLRDEVRQHVRRGDRTARALIEAAEAEGVELAVSDGEIEVHWPDGPDDLEQPRPTALLRLIVEHEAAVVNRIRLNRRDEGATVEARP